MAKILQCNGVNVEVQMTPEDCLYKLQKIVGGYIECLQGTGDFKGFVMVINEEGKLRHFETNYPATNLARAFFGLPIPDYIVGKAVVCKLGEEID